MSRAAVLPVVGGDWSEFSLSELCRQDRQIVEPRSEEARSRKYLSLEHVESQTGRILASNGAEDAGASTTFAFDSRHVLYGKLRPYLNKVALPDFPGRCTTELIPLLPNENLIRREFLAFILRRQELVAAAMQDKTGSRMPRADMKELLKLRILLASTTKQDVLLSRLREQLTEVERARAAAAAQLQAAEALPAAFLRAVFSTPAKHWKPSRLGDVLHLRKEVVHPRDNSKGAATFVGLEHVESQTGRRIGSVVVEMSELTGRKPQFHDGDIVYGYLRPYLNKVWLADFDGLCSVDQYVFAVNADQADAAFVAWFMRSAVYLGRAPIDATPGQLPRIRTEEVAKVEVELPPLAEQQAIAARINAEFAQAQSLREHLSQKLAAVEKLPATLLREAFSGRV